MKAKLLLRADRARMKREFDAQARVGRWGRTGLARVGFTPEYSRVREMVRGWMEAAGLKTRLDAVGILFGRKEGERRGLPAVMTGSHMDSQNPGGRFDGAAGVLMALEAVRRIAEAGARHDHPLEVVVMIEESSCGIAVFGGGVLAGQIGPAQLRSAVHPPTGKSLFEAIRAGGGDPSRVRRCAIPRGHLKAFLEPHIEQGPLLEARGVPVGVVDVIVGCLRGEVRFEGVAAHAGGQPMAYRRDAAMAAAEFMLEMEAAARRAPEGRRVTITFGQISARPGWPTIVPGEAAISFDLRARSEAACGAVLSRMKKALGRIERERGVRARMKVTARVPSRRTSPAIRRALVEGAREAGYPHMVLSSGGIHDASRIASLCPIGMLFVPSVRGLSHTPAEFTRFPHLVAGAEVLASALLRIADRRVKV